MDQCFLKASFDIVVRHSFGVAGAVLSDSNGHIISAVTSRLPPLDVNAGEAHVALLVVKYTVSCGYNSLIL